jgi:hypothetical protein
MRHRRRLATPRDSELGQDVGDVDAGRLRGDEEFLGYLAVGAAGGDQAQDVVFASGEAERRDGVGGGEGGLGSTAEGESGAAGEEGDVVGEWAGAEVVGDGGGQP